MFMMVIMFIQFAELGLSDVMSGRMLSGQEGQQELDQ